MHTPANHMMTMTQIPVQMKKMMIVRCIYKVLLTLNRTFSPYSSIYRTDSGLILRNEFLQSGTSTPGLAEVARQMSKV